jgi:hypothetical protein
VLLGLGISGCEAWFSASRIAAKDHEGLARSPEVPKMPPKNESKGFTLARAHNLFQVGRLCRLESKCLVIALQKDLNRWIETLTTCLRTLTVLEVESSSPLTSQ